MDGQAKYVEILIIYDFEWNLAEWINNQNKDEF